MPGEDIRFEPLHTVEWGEGDPVIALHALALDSSSFAGVASGLSRWGLRTLAADLPGFGRSPAPATELTPARLAIPVLELARRLERPPLLIGHSLGGRVALEVALTDPGAVRGVVLMAPFMPWRRYPQVVGMARHLNPEWAGRIPLEHAWPILKRVAERLESRPDREHDWLARAAVRVIYYSSCPATREAFLSAARGLALDPADGPDGLWQRLEGLRVPATFLWAGRDALIPRRHMRDVARVLPGAPQIEAPCAAHFVSGEHFRCMRHATVLAVLRTLRASGAPKAERMAARTLSPCLADELGLDEPNATSLASDPAPRAS